MVTRDETTGRKRREVCRDLITPLTFAEVKLGTPKPALVFSPTTTTINTTTTTKASTVTTTKAVSYKFHSWTWILPASSRSMDDNDWDLYAVVRGCSVAAASDPLSSLPPPLLPVVKEESLGGGKDEALAFPDLMGTSTSPYELEELCQPFYIKTHLQPLQQRQLQPLLVPKPSYRPSCAPATSVFPALAVVPHQLQQQPRLPQRPVSQAPRSKRRCTSALISSSNRIVRFCLYASNLVETKNKGVISMRALITSLGNCCTSRKNQQKKVVCQVPADGVSRGYYRCSSSKGCQARKQVERNREDPGILVITYTAEHNHPVPTHRNSLSGSTRQKFPPPSSSAQPPPTSGCEGDGEQLKSPGGHLPSSPLSSSAAAQRPSPTTTLTDSVESKDEEEEDEEELLTVGDMEMMGEDDMLFLGMEVMDGSTPTAGTTKSPAMVSVGSASFEEDDSFDEHFFRSPWVANDNAAAAAAGGS
ncbi:hypothetical protein BHE74_00006734 [Ensete ventricosum]|nr:hypothetical protein BHE74_00006734 [Ensete ventricosum]